MAEVTGAVRSPEKLGRARIEGPTWIVLFGCYSLWFASLWITAELGWIGLIPLAVATALHSSLQHEILHGHPTRSAAINEALVFLPLGLFIPYRRFRDLHLRHHNDDRLTDPYDDPESFYLSTSSWQRRCGVLRALLLFNATFAGRMIVGPALAIAGFLSSEFRALVGGDRRVADAWARHVVGLVPVLWIVALASIPLWVYALFVAYPALSLIMVRSYIEHRAAETNAERTAVVDAHWTWRLLFLNNNYHSVHHELPALAWYELPQIWRNRREQVLEKNRGYYYPGYGAVMRQWMFRQREPVIHPFSHDGS